MADVTKEVKIEFTGDISKLKKSMKEASGFQKDMKRTSKVMRKEGLRGYKDLAKVTKTIGKQEKDRYGKKALHAEKALQRAIRQTTQRIREKAKASKDAAKATEKEYQAVKKMVGQLQQIRSRRHQLGHRTFGERAGGAARGIAGRMGEGISTAVKELGVLSTRALTAMMGAAVGILTSQVSQAYASRIQYGQAYGQLAGFGGRKSNIDAQRERGAALGFDPAAVAGMARPVARATGQVGGPALATAMQFTRASGMDIGETTGIMGALRQAGSSFGGRGGGAGRSEMVKILALGVQTGLERGRMPEFFGAVTKVLQTQASVAADTVSAMPAARLMAQMQMSGLAGLQGARGGAVMSRIDKAIRGPGGGEAGQALMLQAFGFGKPGGSTTYFDALKRQEQGIFGEGNAQALFGEVRRQYGGGEAAILALREMTGLSIAQLEALRNIVDSNMSIEEQNQRIKDIETGAKPLGATASAQQREFGDTTRHVAELANRLVSIGEAVKPSIDSIEKDVNDAVEAGLPAVTAALETVAESVKEVRGFLEQVMGPTRSESIQAKTEALKNKIKEAETPEELRELQQQAARGRDEALKQLQPIAPDEQILGGLRALYAAAQAYQKDEAILPAMQRAAVDASPGLAAAEEATQMEETRQLAEQEELRRASTALESAVEEMRRSRNGGSVAGDRPTARPTTSGGVTD